MYAESFYFYLRFKVLINKDKIIEEFNLKNSGSKGWMSSNDFKCPICNKSDKFSILFKEDGGVVKCFRNHHYTTSVYNYLIEIDRKDLLAYKRSVKFEDILQDPFEEKQEEDIKLKPIKPPLGYKPITFDKYLDSRGFTEYQYKHFNVGVTNLFSKLKDYVIFLIKDPNNNCIAYLSRSKQTKEWHDENEKLFKEGKAFLQLRYRNSITDFGNVLLGESEITNSTTTILIVEGLMDKANVDRQLDLYSDCSIKCCATFGNKITDKQIEILKKYKSIKDIIIMFDVGSTDQCKSSGIKLSKYYSVKIAEFDDEKIDAGDATQEYLLDKILKSVDIYYFYKNRIQHLVFNI